MSLRAALRAVRHGLELRHEPIRVRESEGSGVELRLRSGRSSVAVAGLHAPLSLAPLVIGLLDTPEVTAALSKACVLQVHDDPDGAPLGSMELKPEGRLEVGGLSLALVRPFAAVNRSAGAVERGLRYALAARRARLTLDRPGLRMTAADLRALDVYYMRARPVYVVTVAHPDGFNVFPMDLVGFVGGAGAFLLALRTTSPSVPEIVRTGQVALSSVGPEHRAALYALGEHHREAYAGDTELPFDMAPSAAFGLPVPGDAFLVREFRVTGHAVVGSHAVFGAEVVEEAAREVAPGGGAQLGHVSGLLARRRARAGRPFEPA